jgi:hypothetical protein
MLAAYLWRRAKRLAAQTGGGERMSNRDVSATWQYHDGTKHSIQSLRANQHMLDWSNQPIPY